MVKCINLKDPRRFRMFPDHLASNDKYLKSYGWMVFKEPSVSDVQNKEGNTESGAGAATKRPTKKNK